jgi:replicative DNA helicase
MNKTEAKEAAKGRLEEYLGMITSKKGSQYICPVCGSGTGENKTPAGKLNDDYTYHCFSCEFHGDIFSLVGKIENISSNADMFQRVYEIFNFNVNEPAVRADARPSHPQEESFSAIDYTEYFKECHARAGETEYFSFRGLGEAVITKPPTA